MEELFLCGAAVAAGRESRNDGEGFKCHTKGTKLYPGGTESHKALSLGYHMLRSEI